MRRRTRTHQDTRSRGRTQAEPAHDAGTVRNLAIRYDATAPIEISGFKIRDTHPSGRWLNTPEALVHSSNIVTARIADNLGREKMEAMLRTLEFDKRPRIELAERSRPLWPKSWGRITNMTVGFGHDDMSCCASCTAS